MYPISEKAAELLFTRYLLQALGLRTAQLFAPSSWQEHDCGYDQRIVGFSRMRQINLQFKSPEYTEPNRFTIRLSSRQHQILQQKYPQKAAYYVAHMFTSLKAVNEEQSDPKLKEARDFLRNFLCIDVRSLPPDAKSIYYTKPKSHRNSPEPSFKTKADGNSRDDVHLLVGGAWERGSTLFEKLRSGEIGSVHDGSAPFQGTNDDRLMAQESVIDYEVLEPRASDLGIFIRISQ